MIATLSEKPERELNTHILVLKSVDRRERL